MSIVNRNQPLTGYISGETYLHSDRENGMAQDGPRIYALDKPGDHTPFCPEVAVYGVTSLPLVLKLLDCFEIKQNNATVDMDVFGCVWVWMCLGLNALCC